MPFTTTHDRKASLETRLPSKTYLIGGLVNKHILVNWISLCNKLPQNVVVQNAIILMSHNSLGVGGGGSSEMARPRLDTVSWSHAHI